MKKFLIRVLLFILLVAIGDYIVGWSGEWLSAHAKGGDSLREKEILSSPDADIIVLGSSRAMRHYNPIILGARLGSKAYNMGTDGLGIIYMYPLLSHQIEAHKPSIVIYDILPEFDLYADSPTLYLPALRTLWGDNMADSVILGIDPTERFKMLSRSYRRNSQYPSLLKGALVNDVNHIYGYTPLQGTLKDGTPPTLLQSDKEYSDLKLKCINSMIALCKENDIELIISMSPFYGRFPAGDIAFIESLCKKNRVRLINFTTNRAFENNRDMFVDTYHLNEDGANTFTEIFTDSIML